MTRRISLWILALLVGMVGAPAALAQQAGEAEIVSSNVSRYDDGGQVQLVVEFRGLQSPLDTTQVQVTENGVPVDGVDIKPIQSSRVAIGVVLLIDTSGSMAGGPLEAAKTAARSFVAQKRPEDFVAVVSFDDDVEVVSAFTTSQSTLTERIDGLEVGGSTSMYDGIMTAVDLFGGQTSALRRNLIVLSDGADEASVATEEQAIAHVADREVRVFGVALESEAFQPESLQRIVEASDGLFQSTPDPAQLTALYGGITRELNNTLVINFSASQSAPGPVEFGVSYAGGITTAAPIEVPGFVTTTTAGPTTTTIPTPPTSFVVASDLPVGISTLRLIITLAIAGTIGLFVWILLSGAGDGGESTFARRLAAYGRRGGAQEEKRPLLERIPLLSRFTKAAEEEVKRRGLLSGVNAALEQGNIPLAAGEAVAAAFGLSAVVGLMVGVFSGQLVVGAVAFLVMVLLVFFLINWAGSREKRRFERQLPDTLTLLATSLRAGYSLLQAVEAVAQEAPNPTAREFGRAIAEARLGRPVTQALDGITQRVQSQDFDWAVMAIEIQREVGGNLAEVLQTVADTMLARNRLRGEIKALTAEGRISAIVLGSLPFLMSLFLWSTNPDYLKPLFEETFGIIAVASGVLLMLAGLVWLRKIVNIEV